jgi:septum formation protein
MSQQIILASESPRRKQLLAQLGLEVLVHPVNLDETPHFDENPIAYVQRMAAEKSELALKRLTTNFAILAADTAVICNGQIMGKPKDKTDGMRMLQQLSGQTHQVLSAISLRGKQHWQALNSTEVTFRTLTEDEINGYWHTGEPADKAGGYAIQGLAACFIREIKGSYSGVMGLPLYETAQLLAYQGIDLLHE